MDLLKFDLFRKIEHCQNKKSLLGLLNLIVDQKIKININSENE